MPYNTRLTVFLVVAIFSVCVLLFFVFYGPIKRFLYKHFTVRMYYRNVRRVTLDNDFYLINDFMNRTADREQFTIDHIMVGEKFIYVIRDRYYPGALSATEDDPKWIFYRGKKAKVIPNPLLMNHLRMERLSLLTNLDLKLFVSIVLINNDCLMTPMQNTKCDSFLVSLKKFPELIKTLENQKDIPPLNEESIAVAVKDFAHLNLNSKNK